MAADDLSTPLGVDAKAPKGRRLPDPAPIIAILTGAVLAAGFGWVLLIENPLGGEPVAVVTIERARHGGAHTHRGPPRPQPTASAAAQGTDPPFGPAPAQPDAARTSGGTSGPLIIKVPQNGAASLALDPGLIESSKYGPLPKIANDGRRPADMFAATSVAEAEDRRPKIAIMIGGLGVSRSQTAKVMEKLPRTVTLGFTPYAEGLDTWVSRARENGHEIMLQVPMEPFDYPNNDPGPQTLLTSLPAAANIDRLNWVMSRMSGYFGLASFMGAKFTASEEALAPVLTEAGRRGLVFLDNGSSSHSLVAQLGPETGTPVASAEIVIDAVPTAEAIDAALASLESEARKQGAVIGVAGALPVTIERIEEWAGQLTSKGIALVPVSAVVKRTNPS